jgi:anti-sigma factor RsiW
MANDKPLSDEQRAELVAYLDGELPKPMAQAIEAKLNTDPRMRAEVDTLRRTWELLDHLPKPEPTPQFASRTLDRISTIRISALRSPVGRSKGNSWDRLRPWTLGIGWAAAVVLAAIAGYSGGQLLSHRPESSKSDDSERVQSELAKDFRVIENQRLYVHADDLEFIRALQEPELFGDEN